MIDIFILGVIAIFIMAIFIEIVFKLCDIICFSFKYIKTKLSNLSMSVLGIEKTLDLSKIVKYIFNTILVIMIICATYMAIYTMGMIALLALTHLGVL